MLVKDLIERVNFFTATQHDLSGKNLNKLFSNKEIVMQIKSALDLYANTTKAIEAIHSFPMDTSNNISIIDEPPLALRSQSYRFMMITIAGFKYPITLHDMNTTYGNFPTQTQGIPTWAMAWEKAIYLFPQTGFSPASTTLTADITSSSTTINVVSTTGFEAKAGRLTIGNEVIFYDTATATSFNGCRRGLELLTASAHSSGDTVKQNNITICYRRRHFEITVNPDDSIDKEVQNKELEIYDEHIESISKYAAYNLLSKVDPARAKQYDDDYKAFLEEAKNDVMKTRSKMKSFGNVRDPYYFEVNQPRAFY